MAIFGTNKEFETDLKGRLAEERSLQGSAAKANFIDERFQWKKRYFERAKNHLASLGVDTGTEFIYTTKHMPGNMLCKVKTVCVSMDRVIEFEVIASNVVMRVLPTSMPAIKFVPDNFKVSSDPEFAEMKNQILVAHAEWTQKDRKAAQARKEKVFKKDTGAQAKQTLVDAYRAEIKDKGFVVGGRVISPVGLSEIKHFNHAKLTVVVTKVGQALPRSYTTAQLSPFTG